MASSGKSGFKPALIIVDMQNDFCPPTGSLAIPAARDLAPTISQLCNLPFTSIIVTQDWHPPNHVSFAPNHPSPNNKPFESFVKLKNPNPEKGGPLEKEQRLWPVHCVQGTPGAEVIDELNSVMKSGKVDAVVKKGMDPGMEMYSVFASAFGHFDCHHTNGVSIDLAQFLRDKGITHVYSVGVAGDYCVKCTAIDAKRAGFVSYVVKEGTKCVDEGENGWGAAVKEFEKDGVKVVGIDEEEVAKVKGLGGEK